MSLHLSNTHQKVDLSINITKALHRVFRNVPDLGPGFVRDLETLESYQIPPEERLRKQKRSNIRFISVVGFLLIALLIAIWQGC